MSGMRRKKNVNICFFYVRGARMDVTCQIDKSTDTQEMKSLGGVIESVR